MRKISKCLPVLLVVLLSAAGSYAQDRAQMIVTPAWLAEHFKDPNLVLLHVGEKGEFEKGHIPGAQSVAFSADISTPYEKGKLSLELLPAEQLKANFERLGISDDSRIVVYYGKDWVTPSTRVIFTLTYFGLGDRTSLLDGGMPAWVAAGHETTTDVKAAALGKLTPHPHPEIVADAEWVSAHLHQPSVGIIDSRDADAFAGTDPQWIATPTIYVRGNIPGAQSIPSESFITDKNQLKDRAAIEDLFKAAGVKPGMQVVTYCWVGQRATLAWFLARSMGYDARLYDGSWQGWSGLRKDLPIEKSPAEKQGH